MSVLFVCRGNIGRSQAAMEYFKRLSSEATDSAGTEAADPNIRIGDLPRVGGTPEALEEDGINIADHYPKQVTEAMIENFDKVICMALPEQTPDWLKASPKYVFWEIPDLKDQPLDKARVIRDHIKAHVQRLATSS